MGLIQDLLAEHGPKLIDQAVSAASGAVDADQVRALLPPTGQQLDAAVSGGGLDLSALLGGGGLDGLLSQLDIGAIASAAGLDAGTAQQGLQSLLPAIGSLLQSQGGAGELLAKLGGGDAAEGLLGAAGKLAGGLFGKK